MSKQSLPASVQGAGLAQVTVQRPERGTWVEAPLGEAVSLLGGVGWWAQAFASVLTVDMAPDRDNLRKEGLILETFILRFCVVLLLV